MDSKAPRVVRVGAIGIGNNPPFVLIVGPCQSESRDHALDIARALREVSDRTGAPVIYMPNYDPAFLCRQTDLLLAAGGTGRAINIKNGPIPDSMGHGVAAVLIETHQDPGNAPGEGPNMILLTEMVAPITGLAAFDRLAKQTA